MRRPRPRRVVRRPGSGRGRAVGLIGVSNIFELAVTAAISLSGFNSGAALATVVGGLIEVRVMLSVARIVNAIKEWYEAGARIRRSA